MALRDVFAWRGNHYLIQIVILLLYLVMPAYTFSWWTALATAEDSSVKRPERLVACTQEEWEEEAKKSECLVRDTRLHQVLRNAVELAISECQIHFKAEKWNCSVDRNDPTLFGQAVIGGPNKEHGFIEALMSASFAHHIAQSCARGELGHGCSCGEVIPSEFAGRGKQNWDWGNCSVNLKFTKKFVASISSPTHARQPGKLSTQELVQVLNQATGREVLNSVESLKCTCHGLSGACAFTTCWRVLPKFRTVSLTLKLKYEDSKRINVTKGNPERLKWIRLVKAVLNQRERKLRTVNWDVVYTSRSPDFCRRLGAGIPGTTGRRCRVGDQNRYHSDSCEKLCCGRGTRAVPRQEVACCANAFSLQPHHLESGVRCTRHCTFTKYTHYCR